jgi:hypothetical protein
VQNEPISVVFHEYDHTEFDAWSAGDPLVIDPILARTGALGRSASVVRNQLGKRMSTGRSRSDGGGYNYAEIKFAERLVNDNWSPEGIVYENYRLTTVALRTRGRLVRSGCRVVRGVFTERFLVEFERLVDSNADLFGRTKVPNEARVDLFAADAARRRAGLWEVKRYCPRTRKTEAIAPHQRAILAFTTYLVRELGPAALVDPDTTLQVELVAFIPHGDNEARRRAVAQEERSCAFAA